VEVGLQRVVGEIGGVYGVRVIRRRQGGRRGRVYGIAGEVQGLMRDGGCRCMREVASGGHGDSFRTVVGLEVGATGRALPLRWGRLWLASVAGVILFAAALMLPFAVWPDASMCIAAAVILFADHCGRRVLALAGSAAVDRGRLARGGLSRG
jgi:hypothetical protein